jgi:hypothetical protein
VRKIKDLLRLHWVGGVSSCRQLGLSVGCGKTAVADCLRRAAAAGLTSWEAIVALDEEELEKRLYPSARSGGAPPRSVQRPQPDWSKVREELARRDHQVTLALLWQEYKSEPRRATMSALRRNGPRVSQNDAPPAPAARDMFSVL